MRQNVAQAQLYSVPRVEVRPLLRSVYLWMTLGLLLTAVVAFAIADYAPHLVQNVLLIWGIIIAMFINFFLRSSAFDFIISIVGVIIFTGLTAYDTQKIARLAADPRIEGEGSQLAGKLSILGALTLYLDFLNLFLFLLRIFGRSQN